MTTAQGIDRHPDQQTARPAEGEVGCCSTVVLGLGNTLLGDDGAGVATVGRLNHQTRDDVIWLDGGTLNFTLLAHLAADRNLIAVDAARLDAPAGTVRVFVDGEMDAFLNSGRAGSIHEVSLAELLDMARLSGAFPRRRALVAIQPAKVDWDAELSCEVAAGVEVAAEAVMKLLEAFSDDQG